MSNWYTAAQSARDFMLRALQLAELGRWTARPNPVVGCVLTKGNVIVGEGWHQRVGESHAEIVALEQAGKNAKGATAYVTLEPCAHKGRTGPCTEALIEAGVKEVIAAIEDPNPVVSGKGLLRLQAAGIKVTTGLCYEEALMANAGYCKRMSKQLPFVRVKLASSIDGRTALRSGESQWITGPVARNDVHYWRASAGVILSSANTVLSDNPQLNVRLSEFTGVQPLRVILDSKQRLVASNKLKLFSSPPSPKIITYADFPGKEGHIDLRALLTNLATDYHCNDVFVEAGPNLAGALIEAGLVDELLLYMAPKLIGNHARALIELPELCRLEQAPRLKLIDSQVLQGDLRLRYQICRDIV